MGKRTSALVILLPGAEVNIPIEVGAELTRAQHRLPRKFGVSVISLQTVVQAFQFYQSHLGLFDAVILGTPYTVSGKFLHSSYHKVIVMTEKVKTVVTSLRAIFCYPNFNLVDNLGALCPINRLQLNHVLKVPL